MLWIGLVAIAAVAAALLLPPFSLPVSERKAPEPEAALTAENAAGICIQLSENPTEYLNGEEWERRNARRSASCGMAFAAAPYDLTLKVKVALAMPHARRADKIALLREAAAQGSPDAYYWIYEFHRSWDRHLDETAAGEPRGSRPCVAHGRATRPSLCHPDARDPARPRLYREARSRRRALLGRTRAGQSG